MRKSAAAILTLLIFALFQPALAEGELQWLSWDYHAEATAKSLWGEDYCFYKLFGDENRLQWAQDPYKEGYIELIKDPSLLPGNWDAYVQEIVPSANYGFFSPADQKIVMNIYDEKEKPFAFSLKCTGSRRNLWVYDTSVSGGSVDLYIEFDPRNGEARFYSHRGEEGHEGAASFCVENDNNRPETIICGIDLPPNGEMRMNLLQDGEGGIQILESNFADEAALNYYRQDDGYTMNVDFPAFQYFSPEKKNVLINVEAEGRDFDPEAKVSWMAAGKHQEATLSGTHLFDITPDPTYFWLEDPTLSEAFGFVRAAWSLYGPAELLPKGVSARLLLDGRTVAESPADGAMERKLWLHGLEPGAHELRLESVVDGEIAFSKSSSFVLEQDHSQKLYFPDVPPLAWYRDALMELVRRGIAQGYPDGTFGPDRTPNRAELLKLAMLAGGKAAGASAKKSYSDVGDGDWFAPHVRAATEMGIVQGYPDGTFGPGRIVNRAEALKIVLLAMGKSTEGCPSPSGLADVKANDWFAPYACAAQELGLLDRLEGKLDPQKEATRAEAAYWLGKLLGQQGSSI